MTPDFSSLRHDLRTPLNHMIGYSEMLLEETHGQPAITQSLQEILDGSQRLLALVSKVLAVEGASPPFIRGQLQGPLNEVKAQTSQLMAEAKKAGLDTLRGDLRKIATAAGNLDGTLVNALIAHCGKSLSGVGGVARPGIVHRLDKDTSGLLVAAKNQRAMGSLAKQFANHSIERAYQAVVWGAPRAGEGVVEGLIGRNPFDRKRMAVLRGGGKAARTRYRLVEKFGDTEKPLASLIECRLETGRTHQIRVHLTHIGHPLIGDSSYGKSRQAPRAKTTAQEVAFAAASNFPRQALHAYILGFQHPTLHKTMRFESPWPADLSGLISALRSLKNG